MPQAADDHDSPWKEALEHFFPQCLALFAPELHDLIDWRHAPQFLDKELQAISVPQGTESLQGEVTPPGRDEAISTAHRADDTFVAAAPSYGRRYADKLVQVRRLNGASAWFLVHIEVQGSDMAPAARAQFAARMFRYRYRILDRHWDSAPAIYSLGILVASRGGEPFLTYRDDLLGQGVVFTFPVVHLAQWLNRWAELEALAAHNPFAVIVMAQLQALRYSDKATRLNPKVALMRQLYGYGYDQTTIYQLFRLIDWMVRLPEELEEPYTQALQSLEQEHAMTYITTPERVFLRRERNEGKIEGQAELLLGQIVRRFGAVSDEVSGRVRSATAEQLETWSLNFVDATTLDDVFSD